MEGGKTLSKYVVAHNNGVQFQVSDEWFAVLSRYTWTADWRPKVRSWRAHTRIDGHRVYMQRLVAGAQPGQEVDHVDHDETNNEDTNLRLCTHAENVANARKRRGTTSRYKGVYWEKERAKWAAEMRGPDNKWHRIGRFDDEKEAARAYEEAARKRWGEFVFQSW